MSYPLSRLLSTATAGYGAYALFDPRHLGNAMQASRHEMTGYDTLAQVFGVRDLAISAFGMFGRTPRTVRTAMRLRIAMDLGDAAVLATRTDDAEIRKRVLAVTLGWAGLNALARTVDAARADD